MLSRLCVREIRRATRVQTLLFARAYSTPRLVETDEFGVPVKPTWSVQALLSSYPTTTLPYANLAHLHKLAALVPPPEGSHEAEKLQSDMSELVRLVEAVKLINTEGVEPENLLEPILLSDVDTATSPAQRSDEVSGTDLLKHAERTSNGFYVVDTPSTRRR